MPKARQHSWIAWICFITSVLLSISSTKANSAELSQRISAYGLFEAWGDETVPGHGAALVRWDLENLAGQSRLGLEFNTDTLTVDFDAYRISPSLEFGAQLKGEVLGANVLFDYFRGGENDVERAISASFVSARTWLRLKQFDHLFVQFEMGGRQWFIDRVADKTSSALTLPLNSFVAEPRLYIAWWKLQHDVVWSEKQRLYPRFRGWATGLNLGLNWQADVAPWGALDPNVFSPLDPRNNPQTLQYLATQWFWGGWQVTPGFRMQWMEELAWSEGEDDLGRRTIGGMTPFTVNVPGVPWGYVHAGDYAAIQWSTHFKLPIEGLEVGTVAALTTVRDFERIGSDSFTPLWGVGGLLDWRLTKWQINLRGGYSPSLRSLHSSQGAWSVLLSAGWGKSF